MKVILSGVTSFTGCHIARALVESGFEVTATLTRARSEYTEPSISNKLSYSKVSNFAEKTSFGSDNFLKLIDSMKPDAFINHGQNIKGYRDPNFDIEKCVQDATQNLHPSFESFAKHNTHFIHTGTVFEAQNDRSLDAYSAYGEAKTQIWELLQETAEDLSVGISKIYIPDPVGPFENRDRLGPVLFQKWKKGEAVEVHNPDFIWDRVPAEWIAQSYLRALKNGTGRVYRPSAFVASNLDWVKILEKIFQEKTGITSTEVKTKGDAKGSRINTDTCAELADLQKVTQFFDSYGTWLLSQE